MSRYVALAVFSLCVVAISTESAKAWPLEKQEIDKQEQIFRYWWHKGLEWELDELPKSGAVEKQRMPWSGYIYPDRQGGCLGPLSQYDRAFHPEKYLASRYERFDMSIRDTPHWSGHCNGWTAAAIRHAEPRKNVKRNGVVFSPADIKGLLAELYVHNAYQPLTGDTTAQVNAGLLHVTLCNWIGLHKHPVGMDRSMGSEIWNYPIYTYKAGWTKRADNRAEVRMNIGYMNMSDYEYDEAPKLFAFLRFHYLLYLDDHGKITGGEYFWDSDQIDLLWVPLRPYQGGTTGNDEGNPHLRAQEVLSLWRESVPLQYRENWHNIDPPPGQSPPKPETVAAE